GTSLIPFDGQLTAPSNLTSCTDIAALFAEAIARRTMRPQPLLPQQVAGDDDAHDFVGAFEDLVDAQVAQVALDREIAEIAVAAMQLQRLVDDMKPGVSGEALGHRAMQGRGGIAVVEARRGAP